MKLISFTRNIDSGAIRGRLDVLKVILQVSDYLIDKQYSICSNIENIEKNQPFLYVDKMSRLFIPEKTGEVIPKIYSIVFPFSYNADQHVLSFNQININNSLNSCMKSIISIFEGVLPETMEKILERCWEACTDSELSKTQSYDLIAVFTELLTFDIGYVRYDYDEEHQNGVTHPLYHLDINYSNQSTYKIGLKHSIDTLRFKAILDTKQECWLLNAN